MTARRCFEWLAVTICAAFFASTSVGGELPVLEVLGPPSGDRVHAEASFAVMGAFKPAFNGGIGVQVFHVLDDGGLIRLLGCSFAARENGKFNAGIEPPLGGWIPGKTRVVVSLGGLPQVRRHFDFEVLGDPVFVPNARITYEPKSSGLTVRLPAMEVKVHDLEPEVTFLVDGSFKPAERPQGIEGPTMLVSMIVIRDDGMRVMQSSNSGPSFVQPDGSCWYQWQLTTPKKPGLYHADIFSIAMPDTSRDWFGTSELPFSIRVTEPAAKPKP